MPDAKTNKTSTATKTDAPATNAAKTNAGDADDAKTNAGDTSAPTPAIPARAPGKRSAKAEGRRFYVDGKAVSKEEWLKAAAANGYDLAVLPQNYFPSINTAKKKKTGA